MAPCTVCRWPVASLHTCGTCGLRADTSDDRRAVDAARRAWDLAAARRAAGGDPAQHTRLLAIVRGKATGGDPPVADVPPPRRGGLGIDGPPQPLFLLGLAPDGLETADLDRDGDGGAMLGQRTVYRWEQLLPTYAGDPMRLRFHLAGGIGRPDADEPEVDPVELCEEVRANLPVLRSLGRPVHVTVADRAWALLDHLSVIVRDRYDATAVWPGVALRDVPRLLTSARPTISAYHLVLARVAATGEMVPVPVELFPAGALPGDVARVPITVPRGEPGPTALPVVVCGDGRAPVDWTAVRIAGVRLPPGATATVTAVLDEAGGVDFEGVGEVTEDPRTWPHLLRSLPPAPPETDLVVAVEHAGEHAAARLHYARQTMAALAERIPAPGLLNITLIGYGQHPHTRHERFGEPPFRLVTDLTAAAASVELERWPALPNGDDFAAAVEDVLAAICTLPWREQARRVVVFIGGKPPYPSGPDGAGLDPAVPCAHGLDWRTLVDRLSEDGVRLVAVRQPIQWRQPRVVRDVLDARLAAWWSAAADGPYEMATTAAPELVRRGRLAADGPTSAPMALVVSKPAEVPSAGQVPSQGGAP